jgi:hypothetical protein
VAFAKYTIDNVEARLMQSMNEMVETVEAGDDIEAQANARYMWDFSRVADDC